MCMPCVCGLQIADQQFGRLETDFPTTGLSKRDSAQGITCNKPGSRPTNSLGHGGASSHGAPT